MSSWLIIARIASIYREKGGKMRKLTIEEIEDEEAKAEICRQQEREILWLQAFEKESRNATENL